MASVVRMPGVSADAAEATLVEWAVAPGDRIRRGEVLATVETEKAVVDLEADADGVLLRTFASAGESVEIGGPIAVLVDPGEEAQDEAELLSGLGLGPQASGPLTPADEERSQDQLVPGAEPPIEHTADEVVTGTGTGAEQGRVMATPLVRRLAAEAGVPLAELTGSGPNGRIRRRDLEAALANRNATVLATRATAQAAAAGPSGPAAAPVGVPARTGGSGGTATVAQPSPAGYTDLPVSRFRRAVAGALTASKQNVPHFYLKATCRVDELLRLRQAINGDATVKVTINDFIVKAAGAAMVRVPEMNVAWTGEAVRQFDTVDIAVAMATERGLMTPVVRSVATRSLTDVSREVKDLSVRAAGGSLRQPELEGGSLTISNLGMFGVQEFTAIINPPQVGILAVGAVAPGAVEGASGALELARCITFVLSVDHRPVDGALAAQWFDHFKQLVEHPIRIVA